MYTNETKKQYAYVKYTHTHTHTCTNAHTHTHTHMHARTQYTCTDILLHFVSLVHVMMVCKSKHIFFGLPGFAI